MNVFLFAAACLTVVVAMVHSILGEVLIFRNLRKSGLVPTKGGTALKERHVRILWASWHVLTILGLGMAVILFRMVYPVSELIVHDFIMSVISISMFLAAILVLVGTKARHPGWVGLSAVAVLLWLV